MKLKLLDCTLRDGGYINDWRFGERQIREIANGLTDTNVDIIELGFLKNEPYQRDRAVFHEVSQLVPLIPRKRGGRLYAAMAEVMNPIPVEVLTPHDGTSIDIIRVIVWKRLLREGFTYCRGIVEKGYKLCVQPARTEQYSLEEYAQLIRMYNSIHPYAVYVVDSWGSMCDSQIMQYLEVAHKNLNPDIALGYHGHNNLMQAFGAAQSFIERGFDREIILDASIYGIGRGAGNLNIEIMAHHLNTVYGTQYNIMPMISIYQKYLKEIRRTASWGYNLAYFLTAVSHCNPEYARYYTERGVDELTIERAIHCLSDEDRIIFTSEKAEMYLARLGCKEGEK